MAKSSKSKQETSETPDGATPDAPSDTPQSKAAANSAEARSHKRGSGTRRNSLGRGLGALLSNDESEEQAAGEQAAETSPTASWEVPVEQIRANPYQPRQDFDEHALQELADSIAVQGVIQPLTLRQAGEQRYELIAGERRLRAAKMAGLQHVPAFIRTADDEQMLEMAIIENIQREDLNPIEAAYGYKRLIDECQLTIDQAAGRVGKKRATINNYLRLLKLPAEIQTALREDKIKMGHARALISVDNPVSALRIFQRILQEDLSVRKVEELVRNLVDNKAGEPATQPAEPTAYELQVREVAGRLESRLATKVNIQTGKQGQGEIRLKFYSTGDLNRLLELLEGEEKD